jgi:drug/metabolite transporter (DMT)-like permease
MKGNILLLKTPDLLILALAGSLSVTGILFSTAAIAVGSAEEAAPYGYLEVPVAVLVEAFWFLHTPSVAQMAVAFLVIISACVLARMRVAQD